MSIEEKAKAYDEALERANKQRADYQKELDKTDKNSQLAGLLRAGISAIDMAFPELHESEDERIRKEILSYFNSEDIANQYVTEERRKRWTAWLEKQKEQKPVECVTDAEMKKGLDELTQFKCFASALSDMYNIIPSHSSLRPKDIDWNNFCAGLLTYLKRNQPVEWSEEDEKKRNGLIKGLEDRMGFGWASYPFSREEYIAWLKSLRPSWKPSEEQMRCFDIALALSDETMDENLHNVLVQLREQLIKL